MADCMEFPGTIEELMEQYKVVDTEHENARKEVEVD